MAPARQKAEVAALYLHTGAEHLRSHDVDRAIQMVVDGFLSRCEAFQECFKTVRPTGCILEIEQQTRVGITDVANALSQLVAQAEERTA